MYGLMAATMGFVCKANGKQAETDVCLPIDDESALFARF